MSNTNLHHHQLVHRAWRYKADAEIKRIQVLGRSDIKTEAELYKWTSPLFMPRDASRITLEITNIRVEKLQSISEEDAKAEGGEIPKNFPDYWHPYSTEFKLLWDEINGKKYPWESNPYVWVLEFKKLEAK